MTDTTIAITVPVAFASTLRRALFAAADYARDEGYQLPTSGQDPNTTRYDVLAVARSLDIAAAGTDRQRCVRERHATGTWLTSQPSSPTGQRRQITAKSEPTAGRSS